MLTRWGTCARACWFLIAHACATLYVLPAHAQVGLWDEVRDPKARIRASARRLVLGYAAEFELREVLATCLTVLPFADAELRYLCGARLARSQGDSKQKSLLFLKEAIAQSPKSAWVGNACYELGVVALELGKVELATSAFTDALGKLWQPKLRAQAHYGRALAYVTRGHLSYAEAEYRRALAISTDPGLFRLAQFGLGVALERAGDLASGLAAFTAGSRVRLPTTTAARRYSAPIAERPLSLKYEDHYYLALEAMALAEGTPEQAEALRALELARGEWGRYLEKARRVSSPWVEHAEANRARCERKLAELKRL